MSITSVRRRPPTGPSNPCHAAAAIAAAAVLLALAAPSASGDEEKLPLRETEETPRARGKDVAALSLEEAVAGARKDYRPFLLYYDGGEGYRRRDGDLPGTWEKYLGSSTFRKALRKLALCRIGDGDLGESYPPPPSDAERADGKTAPRRPAGETAEPATRDAPATGERLGVVAGVPALVFVDFRERVVRRIVSDVPSRSKLQGMVLSFASTNARLAAYAVRAEKVLEESRYAYELGKKRVAVLKVVPFEDPKERKKMDPVLLEKVDALVKRYRQDARALLKQGEDLDGQKLYARALEVLEELTRDYPFADIARSASQKRGEILRKAQLGI